MSGSLVLVATPIGNLGDLSPRALDVLTTASVVYCEDTRRSRTLFSAHGVKAPPLVALHEHNEMQQCEEIVRRVLGGETVALVSDAGTPGISDPGSRAAGAVINAGGTVTAVPGASSVLTALVISGLPTERFVFDGFLSRKASERDAGISRWEHEARTVVFLESPQRIVATIAELAQRWPDRRVAVTRELTKLYETVLRGTLRDVSKALSGSDVLGEVTVVLEGSAPQAVVGEDAIEVAVRDALASGSSVRDVANDVATSLGVPHRQVYEIALRVKGEASAK